MTTNISGFGLQAQLTASNTFPNGVAVTAYADDADAIDSPDLEAADTAMGLNGDMVVWTRPQGIEIVLSVIPTSADDINLSILLNANRIAKGKTSARDAITLVLVYPNGLTATASSGVIISGSVLPQIASSGRFKTRSYRFRFEQLTTSAANVTA